MEKKRILALDPGSRKIGYAFVDVEGKRSFYVESGVLDYSKMSHYFDRLPKITRELTAMSEAFSPDEIALEALIYAKSPSSLIKLAQARGAIIASFAHEKYRGKIFEYAPNLVKTAVTGHGHATKEGIQKAVSLILGKRDYATSDESDALAIALCHILSPTPSRRRRSLKEIAGARGHDPIPRRRFG
ncbi:MAG: crossover junction endodeoxyribonuclease RuvC [Bacteriovoracales bacterium]|nr:crossover junction endodeoxyribonuclease RuvC [Bacteriovoracales bacterium]